MTSLKTPAEDLEQRTPVWQAMGEFFLDSDPVTEFVAKVCADSPYSLAELDAILFYEVWPALCFNLTSCAGEWAGWEKGWLTEQILKSCRSPSLPFWWMDPIKLLFSFRWRPWWRARRQIAELRQASTVNHSYK